MVSQLITTLTIQWGYRESLEQGLDQSSMLLELRDTNNIITFSSTWQATQQFTICI